MTKSQIKKEFVRALKEGRLIDPNQKGQVEVFNVSMDKYSDIIYAIQSKKRVLDVGCAGGVMLSMLHKDVLFQIFTYLSQEKVEKEDSSWGPYGPLF